MKLFFTHFFIFLFLSSSVLSQTRTPRLDITLKDGRKLTFVTRSDGAEFGSYAGERTTLYLQSEGKLIEQKVYDQRSKLEGSISLMRSLKANWRLKEFGANGFPEIYRIICLPVKTSEKNDVAFEVTYDHYLYDGDRWSLKRKVAAGFWENEGEFPGETLFP